MDKQKEWWLPLNTLIINSDEKRPSGIHVIEHSAYLSLESKLKVAADALMLCTYDDCGFDPDAESAQTLSEVIKNMDRIAREALSKIEDTK